MFEMVLYLLTLLASLTFVSIAGSNGLFSNAFQRGFAGVSTQVVSSNFLLNYTNTESFLRACLAGEVGFAGYVFMAALGVLVLTWVNNLYNHQQAIL